MWAIVFFSLICCGVGALPVPRYSWLFKCNTTVPYAHNVILEVIEGQRLVAAAFQAGDTEGARMHIRFTMSNDDGETWSDAQVVVQRNTSAWGPVLHFNVTTNSLLLFYALSNSSTQTNFSNPGGDLFFIESRDLGLTWGQQRPMRFAGVTPPGEPKYLVNQMAITPTGAWVLPYGTTTAGYPNTTGRAGVLISRDAGKLWTSHPDLLFVIPPAPYVSAILEPAVVYLSSGGLSDAHAHC